MIREIIGMAFIILGITFDFLGVLGLVRLPDVYNRLQAATKCVTFGSAGVLFGVFILQGFNNFGFKALIGIVFIFLTSPVAAHAISRAAHRSGIPLTKETIVDKYQEDHELREG
ncbi:MAG: Na+/H+ antiporter subunit G [Candidatus Neomarinimicrobiota bacterium]|nr:Na+/H+ antiporter subunit G [Candidatus Neomarinimicrobiota bacterium]MCD6100285.1 Na+/H+ antiporter subunit G [Candidatus Neomarinimicrobiota bacterium]RKY48079.1 MAG: Na+/H+ antiporter subunit G [Candidatus Neomarinimicrobiota bacterium]RKY50843.1 MAG: Na+/H+ antiporter subunit G [Candidatus Neomarinimicrobiota bacterium]HDN59701.1 Na+/H+ antiporter subunit G [Candidatus Neomarinimicrobiota bacterium]